jgi:hypothetical protein
VTQVSQVLPQFRGVLLLDLASLVHEVAVLLQELDAFLGVSRYVIILILKKWGKRASKLG